MIQLELKNKVVLAVCAHPDDLEFGCGGAVAKFVDEGATVYYLVITDGSKGLEDHLLPSEELKNIRHREQETAAKVLGVKQVFFLDFIDGELVNTPEVRKAVIRIIRQLKPDIVFSLDPTFIYDEERGYINHPDHRAAGQITLDAVFPFVQNSRTFPELIEEGLHVHHVKTVLLNNWRKANYYVDVTETLGRKIEALACHVSQFDDGPGVRESVMSMAKRNGEKAGVEYAEGFVRIDIN